MSVQKYLRTGEAMQDHRLDRLVDFDARSRRYGIRQLAAPDDRPLISKAWDLGICLDQGTEGACVGFAMAHELAAEPVRVPGMTATFARESIYWPAQRLDGWPGGSYPGARPVYEGTSVLAGAKAVKKLGLIRGYRWAFGLQDVLLGLSYHGPCVLGLAWYEGMLKTSESGFIVSTGSIVGGHCILALEINVDDETVTLPNSWGPEWGVKGRCRIRWDDLEKLLKEDGEACFFEGRELVQG